MPTRSWRRRARSWPSADPQDGAAPMNFAKLYTWVVGALFVVAVGYTLAVELATKGVTLEAGHKALHVLIGFWAVVIVVNRLEAQYRVFALTNGILWGA